MSMFKKYGYWINSGKYTAIQKASTLLIGIFSFMLLARILGPAGYGVWGLFLVITSIAETSRTALIRNAFIRFMHQADRSEEPMIQGAALTLSFVISFLMGLLFFLASTVFQSLIGNPELSELLRWYALIILISSFFSSMEMLLNAKLDFRGVCWMYVVRQALLMLMIAVYFVFNIHLELYQLALFYLLSFLAGTLTGFVFGRRHIAWDFTNLKTWFPKLLHFGKYVFGTNISSLLFRSTDNFITFNVFGPALSGYYNACLRISNLIDLPSQVIADVMFPRVAKYNAGDRDAVKSMYEKSVGAVMLFSIPALLIVFIFPAFILRFLAGEEFVVAVPLLRITAFFGFILPFLKQFGTVMDATGHPHINFRVMFFAFIFNIGSNLLGVHLFGLTGAALGTAFTYTVVFIISQYLLHRKFGISVINVFVNTIRLAREVAVVARLVPKSPPA